MLILVLMRVPDHTHNRLLLLKAIRRFGPVARTELPGLTGLSSGLVSQLTGDLANRGLLLERKLPMKQPGRPRTHIAINQDGAIVLGANLSGGGLLKAYFVDLAGNQLHMQAMRLEPQVSLEDMAEAMALALEAAIVESPFDLRSISRAGISLPALIDSVAGEVHYMTTFPAKGAVPFARIVADRLGLPVTIENDISCMARSEHWFGRAQDLHTFTLVHLGFALGSAEYANGVPKAGANGLNPEFGHIKSMVGDGARQCFCGARGCLVSYASMYGILSATGELEDAPFPPVGRLKHRFEQFLDRAETGDIAARGVLEQAGSFLGLALANYITATDPGQVLVAISGERFLKAIADPLTRALHANAMPGVMPKTNVELIVADDDWRWRGTAALALEQTYLGSD